MSLTRKFLSAMGIEDAKIDEIISAHAETVNALKEERDKAKEEAASNKEAADKLPGVEKELNTLKEKVEKEGENPFETQYKAIKAEYEKYKSDVEAEKTTAQKKAAYKALLKEAGVGEKRLDTILKVSDISGIELTDDGKIKDADERAKKVKEEWADFIETEGTQGADTQTPPANNGGDTGTPSHAAELARKYRENLYGKEGK